MILPSNYRDDMTVEDAVRGYLADGESRQDADLFARVLLLPPLAGLPLL